MGRGGKSSWGKGGKGRKAPGQSDEAKAKNAEYLQAVDARWNLVKGSLRHFTPLCLHEWITILRAGRPVRC